MNDRINDKITEIEQYLQELNEIAPSSFEEYKENIEKKAACERYFEKIIEAVTDLAFLLIKEKNFRIPKEDTEAFQIIAEKGIITEELSKKLKDAKGMRNIIAHEYGKIDDEIVFRAITEELKKDAEEFFKAVR